MEPEDIKNECDELYNVIKQSQNRLEELQKICKHKTTYVGSYSYRIGQSSETTICKHCGSPLN